MSFLKALLALFTGGDASEKLKAPAFKEALETGSRPQLIDVRTSGEFKGGHIKGARNIDVTSSSFGTGIKGLDKNRPVLLYCRSGSRSAMALGRMKSAGFTDVRHLAGGYGAWVSAGFR